MQQIHRPRAERELAPRDALAVRFAEKLAEDWRSVDASFMAELKTHFSDPEIVELGLMISQYLALGRLLVITGTDKGACEIYVPDADGDA